MPTPASTRVAMEMMPVERPRVAILSFAHPHAHEWSVALRGAPYADLIAIWDDDAERGQAAAGLYGASFESNLSTLLNRPDVDAVGICSETSRHAELTIAAASAGKHVLCEKPMAVTLADCDAMIAACQRAGVTYMQAFPQRHDPSNVKVKAMLDEGRIGPILNVRKRHGHGGLPRGWFAAPGSAWFLNADLAGGGAFLDEGVHAADTLRWFLGEPLSVWAQLQHTTEGLLVEDNAIAVYAFPDGVRGVLETSWTWLAAGHTLEVYGREGTILQQGNDSASAQGIGELTPRLQTYSRKNAVDGWYLDADGALHFKQNHQEVARQFVHCLRTDSQPGATGRDGRQALAMILAGYESARLGRPVQTEEFGLGTAP
ncbi:MAG: Gfo/Idh/MocA family protein [Chloroflexota bacterium]